MDFEVIRQQAEQKGIPTEKMGRQLVWHDEFDAEQLQADHWCFGRTMNAKDRIFNNSEKCCRVEDGKLRMQVFRSEDKKDIFELSEGLTTSKTMLFKYGYLEICARPPYRHGAWPSFWMQTQTPFSQADYFAEIDIFEVFSSPHTLNSTLHKWGKDGHSGLRQDIESFHYCYTFKNAENLNQEYHIYGFEWDEKYTRFYVDGQKYAQFPIDDSASENFAPKEIHPDMQGFHDFAYIIFNNEIFSAGGAWRVDGWNIRDEDELPFTYDIDWVRLYQNPQKEEIKLRDEILAAHAKKA